MDNPLVVEILLENEYLTNQNANYRSYCQDIADYCLPRKGWITTIRVSGDRIKFNFLYDSTAIGAVRDTAAGMQTYHTNPTSRWFAVRYRKPGLMKRMDVRNFCKELEDWAFEKLNDASFYDTDLEWKTDLVAFGTGTFGMFEDSKTFCRFNELPVSGVNRVVDSIGRLIGIYYNFRLTALQAKKMFGSNAGESAVKSLEKKPFEFFDFVHFVGERHDRNPQKQDSVNMPYRSVWIAVKDKHLISESGFMEMPYISELFYKDVTDANGFSPAMDAFSEIKLINAAKRTIIRGAMKQSDPPLVMPSRGFILPLNLNPAGMNYRNEKTAKDDLAALPVGNGRIDIGIDLIRMIADNIENRMFSKLFRTLNEVTKQMTVPEVQQRVSESMALLGPVINRINRGQNAMLTRLVNMGARDPQSGFPEMPEGLEFETFDFVYLSPLAKAQRQSEVLEIQAFINDVSAIGSVIPSAFNKLDEDKTIDVLHRVRGVTPEILRTDQEVERRKQLQQEQDQMVAQLQMAGGGAQIAESLAKAKAAGDKAGAKK